MKKQVNLLIVASLLLSFVVPVYGVPAPQSFIIETTSEMIEQLEKEKDVIAKNPARLHELVNDFVMPYFDFERMSRSALGKYWKRTEQNKQQDFIDVFKQLLVRTYAKSLAGYAGQEITYLPFRGDPKGKDVTVRSEVSQPGSFPIPVNYKLSRHKDTGKVYWKVYDVTVDGISLIANYRSRFVKEIRKGGIDRLINALEVKNGKSKG